MTIEEFIAAEAVLPFAWGESDCAMTACRWVEAVTGIHPIAEYGRLYSNERQAREWLAERGSVAVGMNRVMRHCGFAKTAAPRAGDVGLIVDSGKVCVGIHAGLVWFSRDENGLIGAPLNACWKAWRVECPA